MFNTDVATGEASAAGYSSMGRSSAWTTSELPPEEGPALCYVWDIFETCVPEQIAILASGSAITKDFILIGQTLENGMEILF